jgi:hypothetical protein
MSAVSQFTDTLIYLQIEDFTSDNLCDYVAFRTMVAGSPRHWSSFIRNTKELTMFIDLSCYAGGPTLLANRPRHAHVCGSDVPPMGKARGMSTAGELKNS